MRDRHDVRRCEALSRKGGHCESKAMVYHQDGAAYLACLWRHNAEFRPATVARPPITPLTLSPRPGVGSKPIHLSIDVGVSFRHDVFVPTRRAAAELL